MQPFKQFTMLTENETSTSDNTGSQIEYGAITTEKFAKNVWQAKCFVTKPLKSEVTMKGNSEQNAIAKLKAFLANKPYSNL